MTRRYSAIVLSLILSFLAMGLQADTIAPDIIPEPKIPPVLKDLSPLDFRASDKEDLTPELTGAGLQDEDGNEIEGVTAEWGTRCPEGFDPVDQNTCRKVNLVPKQSTCQDGFDLIENEESIEVCRRVDVVDTQVACPADYTMDESGQTCSKTETVPADPTCDDGWTLNGEFCEKVVTTELAESCPSDYELVNGQCEKEIRETPSEECPPYSEPEGNMCSSIEIKPAEIECPDYGSPVVKEGLFADSPGCEYPLGMNNDGAPEVNPTECKAGYAFWEDWCWSSEGTSCTGQGYCYHKAEPTGCRWGTLKYKDWGYDDSGTWACEYPSKEIQVKTCMFGSCDTRPAQACRNEDDEWEAPLYGGGTSAYRYRSSDTLSCINGNTALRCPAGYTGRNGRCESIESRPEGVADGICKEESGGMGFGPTNTWGFADGQCWLTWEPSEFTCGGGEPNPDATKVKTNYSGDPVTDPDTGEPIEVWDPKHPEACFYGEELVKGAACPDGYQFDGEEAQCAAVNKEEARPVCEPGYESTEQGACVKRDSLPAEISCPSGYELAREAMQCVASSSVAAKECPTGYTDDGNRWCERTTVVDAKSALSCPVGTIPQFCKVDVGFAANWLGNFGDENLTETEQRAACEAYTRDLPGGDFIPITESTQCSEPTSTSPGQGYHCVNGICTEYTADQHEIAPDGTGSQAIEKDSSCPTGFMPRFDNSGTCVKNDRIAVCPTGYERDGQRCVSETNLPPEVECPAEYDVVGDRCSYVDVQSPEYTCESGQRLEGTECLSLSMTSEFDGESCPEGTVVTGGSCVKTETLELTERCPEGFTEESGVCQRTDQTDYDLTCPDESWALQSTVCWRSLQKPSFTECPDGEWVVEGQQCKRTVDDAVNRVCPEGYSQSDAYHDECVRIETEGGVQSNLLTVSLPKVWPGSYTLELSVQDDAGNENTEQFDLNYFPQELLLRDGSKKLSLPAVKHSFTWRDGAATLVTAPIEIEGEELGGIRPVFIGVSANAKAGYKVAGVEIAPGEYKEVVGAYNFTQKGGVLELPMHPMGEEASTSDMVISLGGDGDVASIIQVDAWTFTGEVKPNAPSLMQIFEELQFQAEGGPCTMTGFANRAEGTALDDPYCLIEWTEHPEGLEQAGEPPRVQGRVSYDGTEQASFTAYLVDDNGEKVKVGQASASVEVQKAFGSFDYDFSRDISEVYHTVQEINSDLHQVEGPGCRLTMEEDRAIDYAQNGYVGRLCYLEWFDLPGTLEQAPEWDTPLLRGRVFSPGEYELGFRVYGYTPLGVPVLIAEERVPFEALDPPAPTVEFEDGNEIVDGLYEAYLQNERVASALVKSENADLEVLHTADGEVQEQRDFRAAPWSDSFRTYQRVSSSATELWERNTHVVSAKYKDLPSLSGADTIETLAVPGEDIGPMLYSDARYVLNDDVIPVNIRVGNVYQHSIPYDPALMGDWEVRVVLQDGYNEHTPLTEWSDIDAEGNVNMDVNIADLGIKEGYARLFAQARVKSPVPEYSRTELSNRPVFLSVLYGGDINADITGREVSGPVPFRGVFRLDMTERGLSRALGDVVWFMSTDGGNTWEERDNNARNMQYFDVNIEEPGKYLLKARLDNRNSEARTETSPIEITTYYKPEMEVDWTTDVFVGEEVTLKGSVTVNGEQVTADEVDIEWSNDAGETWEEGGLDHLFERQSNPEEARRERWAARVKTPIAPEDDPMAWTTVDGSITYRIVRGPRLYIRGPRVVEVGKPYEYTIYRGLPYPRMEYEIKGHFILPDGSKVAGDSVTYTPTDEDLANRYVHLNYDGWIEGWKDKGATSEDDYRLRTWKYRFPDFEIDGRYSADVAPVEATLYARAIGHRGRLDEPEFTWTLPENVQVTEDVNPKARRIIIPEPGNYEIGVHVKDARGNETSALETIEIGEPEPYELTTRIIGSNEYNRAPYEVLVKPYMDGGHPRDKVIDYSYTVDGQPMERIHRYGQAVLEAGEHTIRLDIMSEFGKTASVEETVTVYENKPPVCELEVSENAFRFTVENKCHDEDGRVATYQWWVDGEKTELTGYRISMLKDKTGDQINVEALAVDDSGLEGDLLETRITMPEPEPEPDPESGSETGGTGTTGDGSGG